MFAGLLVVMLCGLTNGFIVAKIKVNAADHDARPRWAFSEASRCSLAARRSPLCPTSFRSLATKKLWGLYLLRRRSRSRLHLLLAHTRFFRQYYYIGSNAKAAELSGIRG